MSTDTLIVKDSMKIINLANSCPQFYAFPWSKITKLNSDRIELYHQDVYEPVSIIKMNINDKNISYKKWIPNESITDEWDKKTNREWNDQMWGKIKILTMGHCSCCSKHEQHNELLKTITTLKSTSIKLKNNTYYSKFYNNTDCNELGDLLSKKSYSERLKGYDYVESYEWDHYTLDIWHSLIYIIADTDSGNILSVLYAPECELQTGDCGTTVRIINDKMMMIENDGDVWSVVIVKF